MKTAAIAKLKSGLSEYISIVKSGEEVVVTDRGKPVARIVPIKRDDALIPRHLKELEKRGLVKIGTGVTQDFLKATRPVDKEGLVLKALLDERRTSR
jgi:prevent-host-death family protein